MLYNWGCQIEFTASLFKPELVSLHQECKLCKKIIIIMRNNYTLYTSFIFLSLKLRSKRIT